MISDFGQLAANFDRGVEAIREANERRVSLDDAIAELFTPANDTERTRKKFREIVDTITARYRDEARQLGHSLDTENANTWLAYNAIQGYDQHDRNRHKGTDKVLATLESNTVRKAETLLLAV